MKKLLVITSGIIALLLCALFVLMGFAPRPGAAFYWFCAIPCGWWAGKVDAVMKRSTVKVEDLIQWKTGR